LLKWTVKWELEAPARGYRKRWHLTIARGGEIVATMIGG
jgi:hypothetical protein